MSTTPNQKDLLAKKTDLEGILKPDANNILHLPDITITLAENGQFYLAGINKKLLTLIGDISGNAVTLDGDAGLTFSTSGGSSTITGITSSSGNSTSLAASQRAVSAKQDALTAGTNINISGSIISATDTNTLSDLTDTAISSLADGQVLKYNATSGKWVNGTGGSGGAEIILGTTAPTSAQGSNGNLYIQYDDTNNNTVTHEYVKISGAWEEIAVGGSSVIANPSGPATDSLSSIEIDGTIYEIQGSSTNRRYLGQLCPRVTGADSHISQSSNGSYGQTVWYSWGAFSDDVISFWAVPESGAAWVDDSDNSPWISYHFDEPRYFIQLTIDCGSNYDSAFSGLIYIEASNDGTAWVDIGGGAQTINAPYQSITTNAYSLDNSNTWEYIRIRGAQPFFVLNNPSCFMQSINIYGGEEIGGGGNSWTDLTAVLEAGETSLTIIDNHITINGTYDFYTSKYGLNPLSVVIDDPSAIRLLQPLVAQESGLIVTATASTNWSGFEPWKAFANSAVNSGWIADGGSGGYWLQAEFPYKVNISSIDFKSLDSNRSHAISRVSYSNDGNTFTDATLTSSTMQNDIGHADVSMSETAKYIRLCFDYSLYMQTYPMVSQLELYGNIDSGGAKSMTLTFEEQTEDINVKVRVS